VQPKDIPLAVDAHTHLFNATDVHVKGYLTGPVAHNQPERIRRLLEAAAPLVETLGQVLAISCGQEMEILRNKLDRVRGEPRLFSPLHRTQLLEEIDDEREQHRNRVVDELMKRLPGTEFERNLNSLDQEFQRVRQSFGVRAVPVPQPLSQDRARLLDAMREGAASSPETRALAQSQKAAVREFDPRGVLAFVYAMVSPRHHNLRAYQAAYTESEGAFGIDACFASLVDFDYWLDCAETSSSLHDQVLLHEQLAVLSGGYVLPLVPYNPWTDIERRDESFRLVTWAIQERGFVGVKLYPPMGYRPLGNEEPINSTKGRPSGARLDEKLRCLYRWCETHDVPLLAHASHSMGRDLAHDALAAPAAWDPVLTEFPRLKVMAGHFGGAWVTCKDDWPAGYAERMNRVGPGGLYADLAFLDELLDVGSEAAFHYRNVLDQYPLALDRVLYGTDWHMITQLPDWQAYARRMDAFIRSIARTDVAALRQKVYYENAANLFGLRRDGATRARLGAYYARWKVPAPTWMEVIG
jgi:predicted TIM-barrel fold metal-dependent hydrolase